MIKIPSIFTKWICCKSLLLISCSINYSSGGLQRYNRGVKTRKGVLSSCIVFYRWGALQAPIVTASKWPFMALSEYMYIFLYKMETTSHYAVGLGGIVIETKPLAILVAYYATIKWEITSLPHQHCHCLPHPFLPGFLYPLHQFQWIALQKCITCISCNLYNSFYLHLTPSLPSSCQSWCVSTSRISSNTSRKGAAILNKSIKLP